VIYQTSDQISIGSENRRQRAIVEQMLLILTETHTFNHRSTKPYVHIPNNKSCCRSFINYYHFTLARILQQLKVHRKKDIFAVLIKPIVKINTTITTIGFC